MVNTLLIILVILGALGFIAYKIKQNAKAETENLIDQDDQTYTLEKMIQFIKRRLDEITKVNLYDIGLSKEEKIRNTS